MKKPQEISFFQSLFIFIVMSVSLLLVILLFKKPVYYGLFIGIIATSIVSFMNGYTVKQIAYMAFKELKKNSIVFYIMSMIGMLIGIWKAGGIIPAMLYYSFGIFNSKVFLLSAFIISSIISMLMGSSSGTVSIIGIVLIGLGSVMGFPLAAIAGAIVSGAFLGDRSSPASSIFNVLSINTETKPHENFKYFWSTMIPGIILACIFYLILSLFLKTPEGSIATAENYKETLESFFNISPYLLLPSLILIILSMFKISILYSVFISMVTSCIFSICFQKVSFFELVKVALIGYNPSIQTEYSNVMYGGGFVSFAGILIVLFCVLALNGIFDGTGIIKALVSPLLHKINNKRDLQLWTILFSFLSAFFMCNQLISVIIPIGIFSDKYKELDVDKKVFARILADSGVMVSSIIPWNMAALMPASIMGVSVTKLMPYAFLSYIMPIIAIVNIIYIFHVKKISSSGCGI